MSFLPLVELIRKWVFAGLLDVSEYCGFEFVYGVESHHGAQAFKEEDLEPCPIQVAFKIEDVCLDG